MCLGRWQQEERGERRKSKKKSVRIREEAVSCLKGRNGFLTAAKTLSLQSWEPGESREGVCTAANVGRNVCPGRLPAFPRCLEIRWISANSDYLPAEVVVLAEIGRS